MMFIYPQIDFQGPYSDKVRLFYTVMINRAIYQYYSMLEPAGYHVFETPIKFEVKEDIPDVNGISTHNYVAVECDPHPSFFTAAKGATIGHELAHCYIARALTQPNYSWGGEAGRKAAQYVHYADGLSKFQHDDRYIRRKTLLGTFILSGIPYIRIVWFDLVKMFNEKEQIEQGIVEHPNWL